ncbi:putative alternative RNA polymerase sigma factor SigM [Pseudoalteromonas sp. A25]|uniref:RNA polymerase sigma factor n=1 Tax=Pseudoalteromonas sp. A25 TaxID=116092 RepID=UPI0012610D57|nr:RNA polymerase sigma factor [Pseudoalteromonas sp. A25]BBN81603.1 putative alternative RNA polymerase sigma factor SigM [Pseudoalteromonas sp. A25]
MNASEIAILVLEAQHGDKASFEKLCNALYLPSYRFALKLTRCPSMADDVTQEAWACVAKDITKLKEPGAFKAWLYRLIYRRFIDLIRKNKHILLPIDEEGYAPTVEQHYDVLVLINKLPDIQRHIVYLFYFEQMTLADISAVLEMAVGTVKSTLHRARATLLELASE